MKPFSSKSNVNNNKSKNTKNHTTKNTGAKKPASVVTHTQAEQSDWFYMSTTEVEISDIAAHLKESGYTEIDLWEDMGVLEVELPDNSSIDFEHLTTPFKDPSDKAYIESRKIQRIYTVTIQKGNFESLREIMIKILDKWEGVLCADTTDFEPAYDKDSLKVKF